METNVATRSDWRKRVDALLELTKARLSALVQAFSLLLKVANNAASTALAAAQPVTPGDFVGGAAITLAAFQVVPQGTGIFEVLILLGFEPGAADAAVIINVATQNNVTAMSGGTAIPAVGGPPSVRYETGAAPGAAIAITSADPVVQQGKWSRTFVADEAGSEFTAELALWVQVPTPTTPGASAAILVQLASTAATVTEMNLNATAAEQL